MCGVARPWSDTCRKHLPYAGDVDEFPGLPRPYVSHIAHQQEFECVYLAMDPTKFIHPVVDVWANTQAVFKEFLSANTIRALKLVQHDRFVTKSAL